jgi:hypothetical protein
MKKADSLVDRYLVTSIALLSAFVILATIVSPKVNPDNNNNNSLVGALDSLV